MYAQKLTGMPVRTFDEQHPKSGILFAALQMRGKSRFVCRKVLQIKANSSAQSHTDLASYPGLIL